MINDLILDEMDKNHNSKNVLCVCLYNNSHKAQTSVNSYNK